MGVPRFDDRCYSVMRLANREALRFGHEYIDTGHILLALAQDNEGLPAKILEQLGLGAPQICTEVARITPPEANPILAGKLPQTPSVMRAIQRAVQEARHLGHLSVGSEHLLLGLLEVPDTVAVMVFSNLFPRLDIIRRETLSATGFPMDRLWLEWNDRAVVKIARYIAEQSRWKDLPILADALEEAGCTHPEILAHFRGTDPHESGCSILDLFVHP
jgi:hypothetical protein